MITGLELRPLENAILRLAEALDAHGKEPGNSLIRDAVIQQFEFTYELSHKMLKRCLKLSAPDPNAVEHMSFQDLIRTGNERGLLRSDWERWRDWRQARGIWSHTYDEQKARQVLQAIPDFLAEARSLFESLNRIVTQ